jgi:hypothetical protein
MPKRSVVAILAFLLVPLASIDADETLWSFNTHG